MGTLALVATIGGYIAFQQRIVADENAAIAKASEQVAIEQTAVADRQRIAAEESEAQARAAEQRAQLGDSLYRAEQARMMIREDRPVTGMQLALAGLPADPTEPDRPWVGETAGALVEALGNLRERQVLNGHEEQVRAVALSPDGQRIVSGSSDSTVRIWDAVSGDHLQVLNGHEDFVFAVTFSPDGQRIVSGSSDNTLRIWDAVTGDQLQVLNGHGGIVYAVALSPDGQRIVSGSGDGTLRTWDAVTGDHLQVLNGHGGYVYAVAFSPDGRRIVSGSLDNTVRVTWVGLDQEELIARARERLPREITRDEKRRFYLQTD